MSIFLIDKILVKPFRSLHFVVCNLDVRAPIEGPSPIKDPPLKIQIEDPQKV